MKLIYIKSTMEPKNYSTIYIRSILKKAQGEKIALYIFKMNDTKILKEYLYLDQEKITYEIYQEERKIITNKLTIGNIQLSFTLISNVVFNGRNSVW